ncbi:aegerolysin family protein [Methanobrevibacter arboriphilus]|uniref:Uncharacterized protein n=1 Tax=Methanobrevibacter arboriphilus TaxID=39441 RepID=A0ACA8R405_METAZ|nr:aegerolysin family protein [Methanobrevibacter arboriphilus]BBL62397.1 hypothetical protein MarbSA_14370 [Methanobrevibacter arboriphilus]
MGNIKTLEKCINEIFEDKENSFLTIKEVKMEIKRWYRYSKRKELISDNKIPKIHIKKTMNQMGFEQIGRWVSVDGVKKTMRVYEDIGIKKDWNK